MREDKATKVQWRHSAKMGVCEGDCGRSHKKDYLKFPWKTSCCFSTAWLNFSLSSVILNPWNLLLLECRLSLGSNLDSKRLSCLKEKELWAGSWWSSGLHVGNMFRGEKMLTFTSSVCWICWLKWAPLAWVTAFFIYFRWQHGHNDIDHEWLYTQTHTHTFIFFLDFILLNVLNCCV